MCLITGSNHPSQIEVFRDYSKLTSQKELQCAIGLLNWFHEYNAQSQRPWLYLSIAQYHIKIANQKTRKLTGCVDHCEGSGCRGCALDMTGEQICICDSHGIDTATTGIVFRYRHCPGQVWYRRGCVLQLYMYMCTSTCTDTVLAGLISPGLCSTIIYVYVHIYLYRHCSGRSDIAGLCSTIIYVYVYIYLYRHCPGRSDIAGAVFYNYLCICIHLPV